MLRLARPTPLSEVAASLPPSGDPFGSEAEFDNWFESNWPGLRSKQQARGRKLGLG